MTIDFSRIVVFSNGVSVLNVTPYEIRFLDGVEVVTALPCGALVGAKAVETEAGEIAGATLVRIVFEQTVEGLAELEEIEAAGVENLLVVGSIISAQAYKARVVGVTLAPGFERVPRTQKRMSTTKFTTF